MPELPEVETIVRSLRHPPGIPQLREQTLETRPGILGRRIASAEVLWVRTVAAPDAEEFKRRIAGQVITAVERRGKFIVIRLTTDTLLIHLRMSGDIRVESAAEPVQKHDRLLLLFEDGARLVFNDTRKFGRAWLTADMQTVVADLGPEPFDDDLTGNELYERLHCSSRCVKTLLLDQSVIAGVGNIYSDETLHRARLHPALPGKQVTLEQAGELLAAIRETLTEGIARNGASIDWVYRGGDFQNHFRVYQRTGEPCPVCGTKIERRVIGQRSSHFCPLCQPLDEVCHI
jgi:formamidopyrimidine-DNA glycosylase